MHAMGKALGFFALPSSLMFIVALAGILLMATRFARLGRVMLVAAVAGLVLFGITPAGNWLIYPLEQRFPKWDAARGAPDGLIVLGGAINPDHSAARGEPALNEAAERLVAVVDLARRYPSIPIVFSGGNARPAPGVPSEAEIARGMFESFGIAPGRIVLEGRSRTTAENAMRSREVVKPVPGARWLLVTSAYHMPRAIGVFRAAGFAVEAYPVDWRTAGSADLWKPFRTFPGGLARADVAMSEWIGLTAYWLAGRSAELFPGP